jgi:L-ribulose-5-phosphate 4-epimerase
MLDLIRNEVCEANIELVRRGLVLLTWGNASGIDRENGLVVIKPSGVAYDNMKPADMVVVDLDGDVVSGKYKPSVDLATHLALYRAWPQIGGVVHTHSHYATCWAQACRPIPCFGTTHADFAYGEVPLTDSLTESEVAEQYESNTGAVIIRRYQNLNPMHFPAVLVAKHGPFSWGASVAKATENAIILEELARMAMHTLALSPNQHGIEQYLLDKHFLRKHGEKAYYGQGPKQS